MRYSLHRVYKYKLDNIKNIAKSSEQTANYDLTIDEKITNNSNTTQLPKEMKRILICTNILPTK